MASFLSFLFGCGEPTLHDAIHGKVELAEGDLDAVRQLLGSTSPTALRLLAPENAVSGREPFAVVEDGRVTVLALEDVQDPAPVAALDGLRELRLAGPFEELELQGLSRLAVLRLRSDGELSRLGLEDLPALERLAIHGADFSAGLDLAGLGALESLSLTDCRLASPPRLDAPGLTDLNLAANHLTDLSSLAGLDALERLHLSGNEIETLETLPRLPKLRALHLAGNPLRPDVTLDGERVPKLTTLGVQRTGLLAAPAGLEGRDLRLLLDPEVAERLDVESTLEKLRQSYESAAGESVTKVGSASGTMRGVGGRCRWKTSVTSRAEVTCRLTMESIRGLAMARLGETDPAMPFRGGGLPRVKATLRVGEGEVALYVKQSYDLIATARVLTDASDEVLEAASRPTDRFEGYRRLVAKPGEPATLQGDVLVLGSRVVLLVEALGGEAKDVELSVEPV